MVRRFGATCADNGTKKTGSVMGTKEENCSDLIVSYLSYCIVDFCWCTNAFTVFMLQADVLPNMGFSATRKRLVHSHDCLSTSNFDNKEDASNGTHNFFEVGSEEL